MIIRFGYEIQYEFAQPTPVVALLHVHPSRSADIIKPDHLVLTPFCSTHQYFDTFGNCCTRFIAPAGQFQLRSDGLIGDGGMPEMTAPYANESPVQTLPTDSLMYLLGSRYCETEALMAFAWQRFGTVKPGWSRVQAVCDYVHSHIQFGYEFARVTKTAFEAWNERRGVCRDYAHLAITLCRCLNIPARYCTGYLGDIGVPAMDAPMDFAGWFEAYLDGVWYTFDPRNNQRRIGRILMARGRDAADVAITTTFGPNVLKSFQVWTDEVNEWSQSAVGPATLTACA
jgi:transglutaminase-like putative cysteine protease